MAYHHGDLHAALLEAAGQILEERGPEGLTLRAAAQRIGVSHGAPAHHFGDKRGLLTALAVGEYLQYSKVSGCESARFSDGGKNSTVISSIVPPPVATPQVPPRPTYAQDWPKLQARAAEREERFLPPEWEWREGWPRR